ncbi:MAG TPA: PHB depolymerase family esterase, partial [Thermoanaerobaculia bacterium]|nr:PHB depolymerase family esterase [Thermoanaerobaculia bacterium]
ALAASAKITIETLEHKGGARTYALYVPADLPAGPVPLLLTFHGSGRDGKSLVQPWTRLADQHKFVIAGLESKDPQAWQIPVDGPALQQALVEALRARLPIDPRRVYLFGHSGGASFALQLGLIESEYFTAVAVHAGSFRNPADFNLLTYVKRLIPFKVLVGDQDPFFTVASVTNTVEQFRKRGLPVDFEVVKRHDHDYYFRAKKFNEAIWTFLSAHRLESDPKYKEYNFQ